MSRGERADGRPLVVVVVLHACVCLSGHMQDEDRPDVGLLLQLAQQLSAKCHKDPEVVFLVGAIIYQLSACQTTRAIVAQVDHEGGREGGGALTCKL